MTLRPTYDHEYPYHRIFPSGNQEDLPSMMKFLKDHEIPFVFWQVRSGGFTFVFPDVSKFPLDKDNDPFLPSQETEGEVVDGYSVHKYHPKLLVEDLTEGNIVEFESSCPDKHKGNLRLIVNLFEGK